MCALRRSLTSAPLFLLPLPCFHFSLGGVLTISSAHYAQGQDSLHSLYSVIIHAAWRQETELDNNRFTPAGGTLLRAVTPDPGHTNPCAVEIYSVEAAFCYGRKE